MIEMRNASKEKIKEQCNSRVFKFEPDGTYDKEDKKKQFPLWVKQVPDDLMPLLYEQLKDRGVYPIYSHMTKEQIEEERIKALRAYSNGTLSRRIENYVREQDEYKRKGVTLMPNKHFERAMRWKTELDQLLDKIAPLDEELSFLPVKEELKKEDLSKVK